MELTVITPYYQGAKYIKTYFKRMQQLVEECPKDSVEVILVNDSPWETIDVGQPLEEISWLRILCNEKNQGIHKSRLQGLAHAKGKGIIFLDQDDLLEEHGLLTFCEYMKKEENVVWVANANLEQKNGTSLVWYRTKEHQKKVSDLATYLWVGTQIISPGQCCIPAHKIPDFWKQNPCNNNGADDYYLWILMLEQGVIFQAIDEVLYRHCYTNQNLSEDTTVTDASTLEFLQRIEQKGQIKKSHIRILRNQTKVKAKFRQATKLGKIGLMLLHPVVFLKNLSYKVQTKTPYGFNRTSH